MTAVAPLTPAARAMSPRSGLRATLHEALRFGIVGAVGFAVDGGVLTLLVTLGGWGPITSRAISFPVAVVATWLLNRTFTFRSTARTGAAAAQEYLRYFGVQLTGALVNVLVYAALVLHWPALGEVPILPLAIASAVAMVVNFAGARLLVFSSARGD
jgi:putative flippase GtrA